MVTLGNNLKTNTVIAKADRPLPKSKEQEDAEFKKACAAFEGMFLEMMVKTMRKASMESSFVKKNNGEKIFTELLDQQYVDVMSASGGNGLGDTLYKYFKDTQGYEKPVTGNNFPYKTDMDKGKEKIEAESTQLQRLDLLK